MPTDQGWAAKWPTHYARFDAQWIAPVSSSSVLVRTASNLIELTPIPELRMERRVSLKRTSAEVSLLARQSLLKNEGFFQRSVLA